MFDPAGAMILASAVVFGLLIWGTVVAVRRKVRGQKIGATGIIAAVLWVAVIVAAIRPDQPGGPVASPAPAPNKPTGASYSPWLVEMAVKEQLRDPDSARFGEMWAHNDRKFAGKPVTAVCGSVNAKNGYGGYTGDRNFVFVEKPLIVLIDNDINNSAFVRAWNALCAGKHG